MKIVTDCAADMPNEELERLGIVQAPLFIQFPEGEVNAMEISADEFYNRLEAMRPQIPTTAQPSSGSTRRGMAVNRSRRRRMSAFGIRSPFQVENAFKWWPRPWHIRQAGPWIKSWNA